MAQPCACNSPGLSKSRNVSPSSPSLRYRTLVSFAEFILISSSPSESAPDASDSTASFPQTHPRHSVRVRPYVVQEHQHEERGWKYGPEQKRTLIFHVHQVHDAHERLETRQAEQGEEQGSHR